MAMAFCSPNYTQTPNDFFDEMLPEITDMSELKVTLAAIRQTFGYHREQAELSQSFLEKATGMARNSVKRGLELAIERGTLYKVREETNNDGAVYAVAVVEGQPLTPGGSAVDRLEGQPLTPKNKERKNKENIYNAPGRESATSPEPQTPKQATYQQLVSAMEKRGAFASGKFWEAFNATYDGNTDHRAEREKAMLAKWEATANPWFALNAYREWQPAPVKTANPTPRAAAPNGRRIARHDDPENQISEAERAQWRAQGLL